MIKTFEQLKEYAKDQGFDNLRIQFNRAANISSATQGHFSIKFLKVR